MTLSELRYFPTQAIAKRETARVMRRIRADYPFAPIMLAFILNSKDGYRGCISVDTPFHIASVTKQAADAGMPVVEQIGEFKLLDQYPEEAQP